MHIIKSQSLDRYKKYYEKVEKENNLIHENNYTESPLKNYN